MSRITKLYKPEDLNEIISLMANKLDISLDPFTRISRLVKELHGWKIVKLEKNKV